jgi:DnaJ-class molecular chaperone
VDPFGNYKNRKVQDSRFDLKVSLEEIYNGGVKIVNTQKNIICSKCRGTGAKDGKIK